MLTADVNAAGDRKSILPEDEYNATNFLTLWDFEGVLKYSPLFYGWYTNRDSNNAKGYRLPFAYFITGLMVYAYSFVATLKKMAENSRMSKLSEKDDEYVFTWKLFTAWDFMIGNAETAHNRIASIVMGFKEALVEEAEKKRESRNWKVIGFRVLVNTIVLGLLSFSAFAVIWVVRRSTEAEAHSTVWRKNEITVVMSLISLFFPMMFEVLGFLEQYHPRKQLRLQLARIMVLNLLNLYSLIFALFDKIADMTTEGHRYRNNITTNISHTSDFISNGTYICCKMCMEIVQARQVNFADLSSELIRNARSNVANYTELITQSSNNLINGNTSDTYWDLPNSTVGFNEIYINETVKTILSNVMANNATNFDAIFNDTRDMFVDYLTNILNSVQSWNNETITESDALNFTLPEENFSEIISTTIITPNSSYDFSTTTLFDPTPSTDERDCVCPCPTTAPNPAPKPLNYTEKAHLRSLCWETMFGQELVKLTIMDLILTVLSTLAIDFFRGLFVRYMNNCWCWDLEKKFPQYGDFKVAENILHLVNNQGMVWMGMFFSPGLVVLNVAKLFLMMYLRAWAVLTCNVPHEIIFRASRSNNFYYALLLMMLFLCVLPVGYAIVWVEPSWNCGPFSEYDRIFHIFTKTVHAVVPGWMQKALDYIASPSIVIPLLVLLILIIYYLVSLTGALREANSDLKIQLRRERTEERRKMFQIVDRRNKSGNLGELPMDTFGKWKKILSTLPGKSFEERGESEDLPQTIPTPKEEKNDKPSVFLSKFIRKALRLSSTTDEEQNVDEATDTDQQDSLPEDINTKEVKVHQPLNRNPSNCSSDYQMNVVKTWTMKAKQIPIETETNNEPILIKNAKQLTRQDTFELKRNSYLKKRPSVPIIVKRNLTQQDSQTSIRSENIPVIRISKSESVENICEEISIVRKTNKLTKQNSEEIDDVRDKVDNQRDTNDTAIETSSDVETVLQNE